MNSSIPSRYFDALLQSCTRAHHDFTLELCKEFETWVIAKGPIEEKAEMYDLADEFLAPHVALLPPAIPVYVKTMTGELIQLSYHGTTQDLARQLSDYDPATFPLHRLSIIPLGDPTQAVAAEDLFAVFVRPPSRYIEFVKKSAWYDFTKTPWHIYQFTVHGLKAFDDNGLGPSAVRFSRHSSFELYVCHDILQKTFSVHDYSRKNKLGEATVLYPMCSQSWTIEALAENVRFYTMPTPLASSYTLTKEAKEELIALYEAVKQ